MGGLPTCKGEQLTFWPFWRQKFGEFEISAWAEHSIAPEPFFNGEPFIIETWARYLPPPSSLQQVRTSKPIHLYALTYADYIEYMGEDDDPA